MRDNDIAKIRTVDIDLVNEFREYVKKGAEIKQGTKWMELFHHMTQRSIMITSEMYREYLTPKEINALLCELTCSDVPKSVGLVPPFSTDFGANIQIGEGVYINAFVSMQDQGGIYIGDGALIGHHVVLATLNHAMNEEHRHDLIAKPIHIGRNAWIGAHATILQGVTIGDNAVVAAGAVVSRDVPENTVVGGVPSKVIKKI